MRVKKVRRIVEIRGPQGPFLRRVVVAYRYFTGDGLEIDVLGGAPVDPPPRDSPGAWARYVWQEFSWLFWAVATSLVPLVWLVDK